MVFFFFKKVDNAVFEFAPEVLYALAAVPDPFLLVQFPPAWAIGLLVVHLALQLERMRLEERVLAETFPEYTDYAARTARLIPGIY